MKQVVCTAAARLAAITVLAASISCGSLTQQGTGSSYLVIEALEASGGSGTTFSSFLNSDVVTANGGILNDVGQVRFSLAMKDPGGAVAPSPANVISIEQYHVAFTRTDGHNVPGVDVPYAFDGGLSGSVADKTTLVFVLVRNQAKAEAPLKALGGANQIVITTIAEVTFYGHDQTGRPVSVAGKLTVSFANFADAT
jgi:hypothetical protein